MVTFDTIDKLSRRSVLQTAGGVVGSLGVGAGRVPETARAATTFGCPDATIEPGMVHVDDSLMAVCADDHPATTELRLEVKLSLQSNFPTVGSLIDQGFIPYFDLMTSAGGAGWSHWLNPAFIGDDTNVDPDRPESVLVDHQWWRPIGVMFIATEDGEPVDPPPAVYSDDDGKCRPWHAHIGLPGRYAWWKYQQLYEPDASGPSPRLPCRTPWMMHVWAYPHPKSVYAHGAPPPENRGGPPAEPAGFETDAVPGEDLLSWEVLPDVVRHKVKHR